MPVSAVQSENVPQPARKIFFPVATPLSVNWRDRNYVVVAPQSAPTVAEVATLMRDVLDNSLEIPRDSELSREMQQPDDAKVQQQQCLEPDRRPEETQQPAEEQVEYVYLTEEHQPAPDANGSTSMESLFLANDEALAIEATETRSLSETTSSASTDLTVDGEEDDEEDAEGYILEEGGGCGGGNDISYELMPNSVLDQADQGSPAGTELDTVLYPRKMPEATDAVQSLEWHIQNTRMRLGNVASASDLADLHSGVVELEIEKGRILSQTPGSEASSLITMMQPIDCVASLEFDLNYLNKRPPSSWKPEPRDKRLRSMDEVHRRSPIQVAKRKWASITFDLELDTVGHLSKRTKAPNLKCDESIVGNSSDDLSDAEPNQAVVETVLMPCLSDDVSLLADGLSKIKAEPGEYNDLPVMLEGRQLFNSTENTLEATKAKVRECFRPSAMGPEPTGFDFLHWQSNVGVLFGSNLNFFVNALGIVDVKVTEEPKEPLLPKTETRRTSQPVKTDTPSTPAKNRSSSNVELRDTFWQDYMESRASYAAPQYLFRHTQDDDHCLQLGMQVELIDPKNVGQMTVGLVNEVVGGRVVVTLATTKDSFYFNRNSWRLFPIGAAAAIGMPLEKGLVNKKKVVLYENATLVHKLKRWKGNFKPHMQLEAFDCVANASSSGSLRPATVRRVIKNRLLITFDGDERVESSGAVPKSSFWCTEDSPLIRPVNYHVEANLPFLGPKSNFRWDRHMLQRKTSAAPFSAFHTRKSLPFREGMQLEMVDRINPQVMRPATVKAVLDYEIQVQYDGFPEDNNESYNVWTWDDSEDLFPIGWCLQHLHVLVVNNHSSARCSRRFCGDVGNRNPWRMYHSTVDACPYRVPDFQHSNQRDPALASRFTRFPKKRQNREASRSDKRDEVIAALEAKLSRQADLLSRLCEIKDYGPAQHRSTDLWRKHVEPLNGHLTSKSPLLWNCTNVEEFINSVPQCQYLGSVFKYHDIDGEALLSLTEGDLSDVMSLKQGVIIKIKNAIVKLRTRVSAEVFPDPQ